MGAPLRCDLFCTVIDNFGDAGVCWRLARQLANEYGWHMRLFIDQPEALAALRAPGSDSIVVAAWPDRAGPWPVDAVADVVIEAFACEIPDAYLQAMARRARAPIWINLDYLSAEPWVSTVHLGRSPHPRLPLEKTFFFPGLTTGTGGLLRERDFDAQRRAFLDDAVAQAALWRQLRMPPPPVGTTIITLFCYENPALEALLAQWSGASRTLRSVASHPENAQRAGDIALIVPAGRANAQLARYFGMQNFDAGTHVSTGALRVYAVPFVDQSTYDRLLWLAHLNFVRGEDSFVRAQWAERPFVWHIYPQAADAHLDKLDAALDLYTAALPAGAASAVRAFWHAWNHHAPPTTPLPTPSVIASAPTSAASISASASAPTAALTPVPISASALAPDWHTFWPQREALASHAAAWSARLREPGSLAANLADLVQSRLK